VGRKRKADVPGEGRKERLQKEQMRRMAGRFCGRRETPSQGLSR
jgi:hypothetical protein